MKPYERYLIWGTVLALVTAALLSLFMPPFSKWKETLIPLGVFIGNILCLAAIGIVREWAERRHNKALLWLAAPLVAVLAYEAWFFLKGLVVGLLEEVQLGPLLLFIWLMVTLHLWEERNEYKEQLRLESEYREHCSERQPSRCPHCGAEI